ncbi:MAG TPA: WhiB family transcriptional regulator [Mycobacteriales bacterium]|nr:WhiB family transcriptional regulator [Mycobacteriales bacterium]
MAWLDDALCAQVDPDLFFPDHRAVHVARAAKRICGRCPARDACRGYALTYPDLDGIWGGTTPRDRQRGRHA